MDTKHFRKEELACKCCGDMKAVPQLFAVIELVRVYFNKPVFINSGYRCPKHNKCVGGVETSQHMLGTAADIEVDDVAPKDVATFLNNIFPNNYGIGYYSTFTHIDVRSRKARWLGEGVNYES